MNAARHGDATPGRQGEGLVRRLTAHWLFAANATFGAVLAGAALAPALRALGRRDAAHAIHALYLLLCPQRPDHLYFVFGYQSALEHREIATLGAPLVGGVAFGMMRPRVPRLGFPLVALATLPMLWDIFTRTLDWRDSDWFTRTWTSALFCLAYVFWSYPALDVMFRGRAASRGRPATTEPASRPTADSRPEPTAPAFQRA